MKKITTSLLLFFGLFISAFNNQLAAQATIATNYHYQYMPQNCTVPAVGYFFHAVFTENYPALDSIDFFIDFGDGNDTTITRAQDFYNSTQASTGIGTSYLPHTYTAQGVYAVTYIATMPDGNADTVNTYIMVTSVCNNVTGRLYVDVNADCIYNAGDIPVNGGQVKLNYNNTTVSNDATDVQGLFSLSGCPGFTYSLVQDDSYYNAPFQLTCSTYEGMPVTPSPNATQDFIASTAPVVHIGYAGDSSSFSNGNCVPYTSTFFLYGGTIGYAAPNDSIDMYINFGDGTDTTVTTVANGSGPALQGSFGAYISHIYTAAGNYNVQYIASGVGASDTVTNYSEVVVFDTCGNVEGYVYIDNNNNCLFDAGDSAFAWMWLDLVSATTGNHYWAYTNANGHYSFSVSPGNYTLSLGLNALNYIGLTPTCPSSGTAAITVVASTTVNSDFATVCPTTFDLTGYIGISYGIFPTTPGYIRPYVQNLSCMAVGGSVTFILDPLVNYVGVCDTAFTPTVNGDTLTWTFATSSAYASWYYWFAYQGCIEVIGDPGLQIGDSVCFTMIVNPIAGDGNPANNTITRCVPALVSLDPNVKGVSPEGSGPLGYIPQNTTLNYAVEFQNTGTAVARNIFILDSLDADLDLTTLVVTGSSHYMETQMLPGNVLKFNFPDIWLADSTSNEPQSHGWVSYTIAVKPNLANGTPVQNTAGIYFDFNAPVITNSTLNTILDPSSVIEIGANAVSVFPNPASSTVEIKFSDETNAVYSLTDLAGKVVFTGKLQGRSAVINVSELPQGVYLLNVATEEGNSVHKVMVQH